MPLRRVAPQRSGLETRADAKALAGILNRDLIQIWVQLEYGPRAHYPRLVIARPEAEDLAQLAGSLSSLVPLGLKVSESEVRDRFGFSDPQEGDAILGARSLGHADPGATSAFIILDALHKSILDQLKAQTPAG